MTMILILELRLLFTPTFTSGKMKLMFGLVRECAEECQQSLKEPVANGITIDFKGRCVGYTIEVISSTAFGLKTNSIHNLNSEFKEMAHLLSTSRGIIFRVRQVVRNWFPFVQSYISSSAFNKRVIHFFFKIISETVDYRKQTGASRNDFLQILIAVQEKQKIKERHHNHGNNTKENGLGKFMS